MSNLHAYVHVAACLLTFWRCLGGSHGGAAVPAHPRSSNQHRCTRCWWRLARPLPCSSQVPCFLGECASCSILIKFHRHGAPGWSQTTLLTSITLLLEMNRIQASRVDTACILRLLFVPDVMSRVQLPCPPFHMVQDILATSAREALLLMESTPLT